MTDEIIDCHFVAKLLDVSVEDIDTVQSSTVEEGVLSRVVKVTIDYSNSSSSKDSSTRVSGLLLKFRHSETPPRMFRTESTFYHQRNHWRQCIPFQLPHVFHADEKFIALEYMSHCETRKLVNGVTTVEEAQLLMRLLATMHANCWIASNDDTNHYHTNLDSKPGVGMQMSSVTKEVLFTTRWEEYLNLYASCTSPEAVITDPKEQRVLRDVCQSLAKLRLRSIHEQVVACQPTLIHGDFHVANILFPTDSTAPPVLVDWATCGKGNPIFDVTFFLLVSIPFANVRLLNQYYDTLINPNTSVHSQLIQTVFPTLQSIMDMYHICVLNEFLILVAYDRLARQFVNASSTPDQKKERANHFQNVARRCMKAVLQSISSVSLPPPKTTQDLQQETELLQGTLEMNL